MQELLPFSLEGKSLSKTEVVASPEQGTALLLLQLQYRKMKCLLSKTESIASPEQGCCSCDVEKTNMQELLPLSVQGKSLSKTEVVASRLHSYYCSCNIENWKS